MILMEMIRIGFTTLIRILLADIINTTGMDFVSMIYDIRRSAMREITIL